MTPGSSSKRDSPVTSTSKAGSRSRSSARASRSAVVRRALRAGDTVPTWLARSPRRPAWNAPPSESRTSASPYQLRSSTVPSGASRSSERCSPADVALVCTTRSHPPAASSGRAKPAPSAAATSARDASTSTSVTSTAGNRASRRATQQPTIPAPTTATRSPTSGGASHRALTAVSTRAGEHGARGRHVVGHDGHGAGRHHVGRLVRVQAEDRAAAQLRRPLLDGADVEVAVLDRPREVALLERRAHRGVLARRHAAPEHQRLGAAADAGPQRADHHVAAPRLGQRDRPDLPAPGRAQPERVRVVEHVLCLGFVRHRSVGLPGGPGRSPRQTPAGGDPSRGRATPDATAPWRPSSWRASGRRAGRRAVPRRPAGRRVRPGR